MIGFLVEKNSGNFLHFLPEFFTILYLYYSYRTTLE